MITQRWAIMAAAALAVGLLIPPPPSASAETAWEELTLDEGFERLFLAFDISDAAAEQAGGYSTERESHYPDGWRVWARTAFTTDTSVETRHYEWSPSGKKVYSREWVWHAGSELFAYAPNRAAVRDAYRLLGADKRSWLLDEDFFPSMASMGNFQGMPSGYLPIFDYVASWFDWDPRESKLAWVTVPTDTSREMRYFEIELRSDGAISHLFSAVVTSTERPTEFREAYETVAVTYEAPRIEIPTSVPMVNLKDYHAADQSLNLEEQLAYISASVTNHHEVLKAKNVRPRQVPGIVRKVIQYQRAFKNFALRTKVKRTKNGARLIIEAPLVGKRAVALYAPGGPKRDRRIFPTSEKIESI